MKSQLWILIAILTFLVGILFGWLVLSTNTTQIVEVEKVIEVEKECNNDVVYLVEKCNNLDKEDLKEYTNAVLEDNKEEWLANDKKVEVRPANYVSYCDRAGVVC